MSNTTRSTQELMRFVVAAGGNLPLAAERAGVSREELVALVTGDESATLAQSLRAMLLLELFNTIKETQIAFRAKLHDMGPDAISRAYASLTQSFSALSAQDTPEFTRESHDAAVAKQNLVTRLERYRKVQPIQVEAEVVERDA